MKSVLCAIDVDAKGHFKEFSFTVSSEMSEVKFVGRCEVSVWTTGVTY